MRPGRRPAGLSPNFNEPCPDAPFTTISPHHRPGRALAVTALARHLLRWSRAGLVLVVPAGLMLFSAHATEFATNPAFRLKLALIAVAVVNVGFFHLGPYRTVRAWDGEGEPPGSARAGAALSIAVWIAVISCRRLTAYF